MFDSSAEIVKLEMYFAEALKMQRRNPLLAASEQYFRFWEDASHPQPFEIPDSGLTIAGYVLAEKNKKGEEVRRIGYLLWDSRDGCPTFYVEAAEKTLVQKIFFEDQGLNLPKPDEIENAEPEDSMGEKVEVMFEVVSLLKRDYPNMNLQNASNALIIEALKELKETHPSKVVSQLYARHGRYKPLLQKVLNEMTEDEVSSQLTFQFDEPKEIIVQEPELMASREPVSMPVRGGWEITRDLELLCEAETEVLLCEEEFEVDFSRGETIVPLCEGKQIVRLPIQPDTALPIGEGSRLMLFPVDNPKNVVGSYAIDVLDDKEMIGTITWEEGVVCEIDGQLHGKPRKSPQGYVTQVMNTLRETSQEATMAGRQQALRGMLGVTPLPYCYPGEGKSTMFPKLDAQQVCAVKACLDERNPVVLVQGPPGTGKTSVLEQVVRELAKQKSRILITAPSNTAIDNICRRLFDLPLLRHAAAKDAIRSDVAERCWSGEAQIYTDFVGKSETMGCEIHAGTHIGILRSPILAQRIIQNDLFDVIIFDEAGMSGSAEVLPCVSLAKRAFFFGDPKQLPPFPLPEQVWERLGDKHVMTAAQRFFIGGGFMGWLQNCRQFPVILLRTCYRCQNPRLMRFSSQLFYDAQVVTNGSAEYYKLSYQERQAKYPPDTLKLMSTSRLPEQLRHEQLRLEGFQPGYENYAEAMLCAALTLKYINTYDCHEICVISPYRRQTKLIRKILSLNRPETVEEQEWEKVIHDRVSTVDSFQGGESDVVLVSYVRSGEHGIGFVDDPNRVNVTHTRARREMVVIGDIEHLQGNSDSRLFLRMAHGFERDGVIETLSEEDYQTLTSSLATIPELAAAIQPGTAAE